MIIKTKRKIERILALTMEISSPEYNYEEKPVVFLTYSGHCPCLSLRVDVCENGSDSTQRFTVFNLDSKKHAKETHKQLDEIIHYLEKIKRRRCT